MKTLNSIVLLCICIGCGNSVDKKSSADDFINQLKDGTYNNFTLPGFTEKDIPELLKYRNETTLLVKFPSSGVASYAQKDCTLGVYVLWVIEAIRKEAAGEALTAGYPSQLPLFRLRKVPTFTPVQSAESQNVGAKAYYDWWNSGSGFERIKNTDPLEGTDFAWH